MMVIDVESRATVELKKVGAWAYWAHPDTEMTRLAYGETVDDVKCWAPGDVPPSDLFVYIATGGLVGAFNAFFERSCWHHYCMHKLGWLGIRDDQWRCSQAQAYAYGLSGGGLETIADMLKLPEQKDSIGHDLMLLMCKPVRGKYRTDEQVAEAIIKRHGLDIGPEDVQPMLTSYCIQDVRTEIALHHALPPLTDTELAIWQADQQINLRGVKVDLDLARNAPKMFAKLRDDLNAELEWVTEGAVKKVTQNKVLLEWLKAKDPTIPDLTADTVTNWLKNPATTGAVRQALECRQAGGRSSVAKFDKMTAAQVDGRLRGMLTYCGAHTRRWSSHGVQLQNLRNPIHPNKSWDVEPYELEAVAEALRTNDLQYLIDTEHPLDWIANSIRSALVADGVFIDVDYAGIEMRKLAFLADEQQLLKRIVRGEDVYRAMASEIYNAPVDQVTGVQRKVGKITILMSGYGGGWAELQGRLWAKCGLALSEAECRRATRAYRTAHPNIKRLWYESQRAAVLAIRNPGMRCPIERTARTGLKPVTYELRGRNLFCHLPSGRPITYWDPRIRRVWPPWESDEMIDEITVLTPRGRKKIYNGLHVENYVQATCRDLLGYHMVKLREAGYSVALHVHDEFAIDEPDDSRVQEILALLRSKPSWLGDFPHDVGHWVGKFYRKD
jgi:DNA polymerase